MADLRLLVTGRTPNQMLVRLCRALSITDAHPAEKSVEIVVVRSSVIEAGGALDRSLGHLPQVRVVLSDDRDLAAQLDAGLFMRPLATTVAVVGNTMPWLQDMILIAGMMERAGVAAAIPPGPHHDLIDTVLCHGGVFAAGPLCTAGGFAGDHRGASVQDRLDVLGFTTLELSGTPALRSFDRGMVPADARTA